jgi:hypothetical protein
MYSSKGLSSDLTWHHVQLMVNIHLLMQKLLKAYINTGIVCVTDFMQLR